ncbi:hypothetical protein [Modestobacter italicus]|uniref:hypothetical protein n=1 Tax=Modestobacter italicus (strain DSM 44449 / CECT 9708 / BC 501) TaxID=2732864 RepID=UPI001C93976B|nr:hypothetical protein [Modestobacter italicus]
MPTLLLWRRIGLAAGAGAVLCVLTGLALLVIREEAGPAVGLLLLVAFVCALVCLGFLQRTWQDPAVAEDPRVVRARSWSTAATVSWCVAVLPGLAARVLPESFEWLRWLVLALGAVAVAAFLGMLVLTARWRLPRA